MKFFLVLLLALGMSLSGFFLDSMVTERAQSHQVLAAASGQATVQPGGQPAEQPQTLMGLPLADSYRSMYRSLHYVPLFLGLVFLAYFLFEVLTGRSLHPAQYALVGIAQIIFYLLLLSLSEHVGFDLSFLIAGGSTVALFSLNTEWIFHDRKLALRALAVFGLLYSFIYVLLRMEAYALLVGALASFAAIAAAMFVTRNVDWYRNGGVLAEAVPPGTAGNSRSSWLD